MIFGKSKLELKVGIFVLAGLAILTAFVLLIGNYRTWGSSYYINLMFNFINGVKIGAPVRFAGVDVGEVKKINLFFSDKELQNKVEIVCRIKKNIRIPRDSQVWVNTLGLLGEKYLEIMPGKDYRTLVVENDTLIGNDPIAMHDIGIIAKNIATDIDDLVVKIRDSKGTLSKLLYEDKIYNDLDAFVTDIKKHPWKLFFKTKEKPEKK